jgi:NADH-quinone oxidoreductase subunit L
MSDPSTYLWLIPVLPLIASAVTMFLGPRLLGKHSHWPCLLGLIGACVLSFFVFAAVRGGDTTIHTYYTWFETGSLRNGVPEPGYVNVGVALRADGLTAVMLITVTFIGSLIAIYSVGYMHGDPGYPRFFAEIALFIFAMTLLVLGDNFLVLYAGWEGVGLCSYLLIGFWFTKPSAAAAARKAFLVTRLGDVGFILGILVLWAGFCTTDPTGSHYLYAFDFTRLLDPALIAQQDPTLLAGACLLLLCGAVGKSAQIPLYVWLPDAMEGPTPVSALIHAATMVTAGVYLVARSMPLFHAAAPWVLLLVAAIGAFTALLAALIALTQTDLKRVLAYSTISQIGYMFLALGSASQDLVSLAVAAAIFHLFTHAFFKALLFLSAGSVMHAMGNVIDMRRFSGLRRVLPTTHWTFLCGAGALAGLPLLSGFWSKDEILGMTFSAAGAGHPYRTAYLVLFLIGLITAGLTAFYTFRAYFLTFWGEERIPPEAGHHAHESPPVMTLPLVVLAVGAVGVGAVFGPLTHEGLSRFLQARWLDGPFPNAEHEHHANILLMVVSSLFALGGFGLAWWMYYRDRERQIVAKLVRNIQALYQLSLNKFHVDELYDALIVKPLVGFAEFCRIIDAYVVDSLVDLVGNVPRLVGGLLRPIQNGLVQFYALAMMLGLTVFLGALVWRWVAAFGMGG